MSTIRVLDFETTGFPPNASVCEIGYTDMTLMSGGSAVLHYPVSYLVRPAHDIELDAMAVHHITHEMIDKADAPACDWALTELAKDNVDVWVAHNAPFEQKFFNPLNSVWVDTLKVVRKLFPDFKRHTVSHLIYCLNLYKQMDPKLFQPLHRAGPDTYATAHILRHALQFMSIQEMIDLTNTFDPETDLLKTCYMTKHKGRLWSEIAADDIGYLRWIRGWEDFDKKPEQFQNTIIYWLNKKMEEVKARYAQTSAFPPTVQPAVQNLPEEDPLGR